MKFWKWLQETPTRKLWILVGILLTIVVIMALHGCSALGIPMTPTQQATSNQVGQAIQGASPLLPFPLDLLAAAIGGSLIDRGGSHVHKKYKARKAAKSAV